MSDAQINILIGVLTAGLAGIAAAIRFSVNRVVNSLDANSTAMLENTKSNAILSTKIDTIATYVQGRSKLSSEVKELIKKEVSGVHDVVSPEDLMMDQPTMPAPPKSSTAVGGGYSKVKRAKTEPGGRSGGNGGGNAQ